MSLEDDTKGRLRTWPDGSFSLLVPEDPDQAERRRQAFEVMERERLEEFEKMRQAMPHRSQVQPDLRLVWKRQTQDRSLGRRPRTDLWPMDAGVYLRQLAGLFPVLEARLALLGEGKDFPVPEWLELKPVVSMFKETAETAAALFLVYVAEAGRGGLRAHEAGATAFVDGMRAWRGAERAAFTRWAAHPFFPDPAD